VTKKPAIVCVDDEQTILDSLEIQLNKSLGDEYSIETAEGGDDALDLIAELQEEGCEIALVISDYIMPGMKGDELLRKVHELSPDTLKIMLTGQADLKAVANLVKHAKLYRFLEKPWQTQDLILTVKEAGTSYLKSRQFNEQTIQLKDINQNLEQLNCQQAELIEELHTKQQELKNLNQELVLSLSNFSKFWGSLALWMWS
jgi:response regulator RpfG family c-di-GMP phosphodiesterase